MNTLYSDGEIWHMVKRYIRIGAVLCFKWQAFKAFDRQLSLHPLVFKYEPIIFFRPLRPYLVAYLNFADRSAAVISHFDFLRQLFVTQEQYSDFMKSLYSSGFIILTQQFEEYFLRVQLVPSGGLGREGELSLQVYLNDEKIVSTAFSILSSALLPELANSSLRPVAQADKVLQASQVVFIGCLKGHPGQRDAIKNLTKKMHGLRPRTLLVLMHQALLNAWCATDSVIVGVGTKAHFSVRYARMRKRVQVNYDEFWQELDSQALASGLFLLPPLPQHKPLSEVKSNKRAETQRRREMEAVLLLDASAAFSRLIPARAA